MNLRNIGTCQEKERVNMKSEKLNSEIGLTLEEREELSKELIKAGIDKKVVGELLGGKNAEPCSKDGCEHGGCGVECTLYRVLDKKVVDQLHKIMKEKNINPKALGRVGSKLEKRK